MKTFYLPKFRRILLTIFVLLTFINATSLLALPPTGTMSLSWPIARSVFQRNASNQANVFFAGQFFYFDNLECASLSFYYRVQKRNLQTGAAGVDQVAWTQYSLINTNTGVFHATISNLAAGWYNLEVKATNGGVSGTVAATASVIFGVGDVFAVAGQSNAQSPGFNDGFNNVNMLSDEVPWDCVNVHNYSGACKPETDEFPTMVKLTNSLTFRTGPSGFNSWIYGALGNRIAQSSGVPTAFFNAGMGNTTVENWQKGAQNQPTGWSGLGACQHYFADITPANALGQPYRTLKNILKYYAKIFGVKAVLWHQGEADNSAGTSAANYQSRLQTVINQSRSDFGSSNLTWYVARASYTGGSANANIISGQNAIIAVAGNNVKAGPNTDAVTGPTKRYDNTHFFADGLEDVATLWRTSIYATTSNVMVPSPPPLANFQLSLPGYPLQAEPGYVVYNWNSRISPAATTQTANLNGRCFVKNSSGDWLITPSYSDGNFCGLGQGRLSAEASHEDIESSFNFLISSNPVIDKSSNITFTMPYEGDVTLAIVDLEGRPIKRFANGMHAPGKYAYPIWLNNLRDGEYLCVLQVNGISISKKFLFQN